MLLRYGQAVKLLKPITLDVCSSWKHVIAQWKTKYQVTVVKKNHTDWNGRIIGSYDQATILIPEGTLGLLTYIHVDATFEGYRVSVPNPVTKRVGGGSVSDNLTADYFSLQITPEELDSLRHAQGNRLFNKSSKNSNLVAIKKLDQLQTFDTKQI